jgi:hypothetical protein
MPLAIITGLLRRILGPAASAAEQVVDAESRVAIPPKEMRRLESAPHAGRSKGRPGRPSLRLVHGGRIGRARPDGSKKSIPAWRASSTIALDPKRSGDVH